VRAGGAESLSRPLRVSEPAGRGVTDVRGADGDEVVGFYTLVVAQVEYDDAPQRLGKGLAKHPIPLMLLARLAVATSWQGKGLGSGLLKDAMLRTLQAADIAGIRAMAVHAKDDDARAFYERFGFMAAPTDPYHLFVLIKDVRAILK
jgi:predicted N-acetyltransferase YhbS